MVTYKMVTNKKKTLCLIIYTNSINISRAADKKIRGSNYKA